MILTTLLLLTAVHARQPAPADTNRTIFGQWQYNKKDSDAAQPYVGRPGDGSPGGYGSRPQGGSGGRPGGGSTGGSGGAVPAPGARTATSAQVAAHREMVELATQAPERLELTQRGDTVAMTADGAAPITLSSNGKKVKWVTPDSVRVESRATWENGRLVVEHNVRDAGKVSFTFYRSPDKLRLLVAVRVYPKGGPKDPVPFRLVYDPVTPTP